MSEETKTTEAPAKNNLTAIRTYFELGPSGRKVNTSELKELSIEDREELGALCRKELGW